MKISLGTIIIVLTVFLTGCGPSNSLIGTWQAPSIMGISSGTITFTKDAMITGQGGVESETKIEYKVEEKRVGVVMDIKGQKVTEWFNIIDKDTIEEGSMFKMQFKRVK